MIFFVFMVKTNGRDHFIIENKISGGDSRQMNIDILLKQVIVSF